MVLFIMLYNVVLTFESVDEILKCDHWNESCWAVLSSGAVYYGVQFDHSNESFFFCCLFFTKKKFITYSLGSSFNLNLVALESDRKQHVKLVILNDLEETS